MEPKSVTLVVKRKSLRSNCSQFIYGVAAVLIPVAVLCFMAYTCFWGEASYTNYGVSIPSQDIDMKGQKFEFTATEGIHYMWTSNAHNMAIWCCSLSIIWPFLFGIILIHLFLVPFNTNSITKNQSSNNGRRTKCLLILSQIGKYMTLSSFVAAYLGIASSLDVSNTDPSVEIFVKSGPANEYCTYNLLCASLILISIPFLFYDQYVIYQTNKQIQDQNNVHVSKINDISQERSLNFYQELNDNHTADTIPKDNKWFILAFAYNPSSIFGLICYAIYLVLLLSSLWLVIESLYTAQITFTFGGAAGSGSPPLTMTAEQIGNELHSYLDLVSTQGKNQIRNFSILVVYMPIIVQSLLLFIWFIPTNRLISRWLIRLLILLNAFNAMEVYYIACFLQLEMENYSYWITSFKILPDLCDPDMILGEIVNFGFPECGCFCAKGEYLNRGMTLMGFAVVIQWITVWVTLYMSRRKQINAVSF